MSETLLPRNQDYFKRLEQYVSNALGVDNVAAGEVLAEIYADLLQAQADGIGAADFFGDDPKAIGDQIIKNLPHRSRKSWAVFAVGAWFFSFFLILWRDLSNHGRLVPAGSAAVLAGMLPVAVLVAMELYRRGSFNRKKGRTVSWVLVVVIQLVLQPLSDVFPKFGNVWLPKSVIGVVGFGVTLFFIGFGMWLGMHSWFMAALFAVFAALFALPAVDVIGTLSGWWGRLLVPGLFVGAVLLIRVGENLLPNKWQANGGK